MFKRSTSRLNTSRAARTRLPGTRLAALGLAVAGLILPLTGETAVANAAAASSTPNVATSWPVPTVWCQYRVTASSGLNERNGPGLSYSVVRVLGYNTMVIAGRDGTVNADGYTWRRIADNYGLDGNGGFSVTNYLSLIGNCVT